MQKASSRIGRVGNRSTQKVAAKVAPKKVALKQVALKKTVSTKRTVQKRVFSAKRTRIARLSKPLAQRDNWTNVVDTIDTACPVPSMPIAESPTVVQSSDILVPLDTPACVTNDIPSTTTESTTAETADTKDLAPTHSLMRCENQTYVIQTDGTTIPQTVTRSSEQFWKHALTVTMKLPPILLAFFGWRTNYAPVSQERLALQMLILNGSVRASNVEFRYSTAQEKAKDLSRSFAVLPSCDRRQLTPLQVVRTRLHSRGGQLIRRLNMQETYGRLCSRGAQLFERVRRELTIRSYLSRI